MTIRRDVLEGRTDAKSFEIGSLKNFFIVGDGEERRNQLYRILTAFVRRNSKIGYSQGMNFIALLFLTLMEEEKAFWTFCAIMENIRPRDFYSRPPATLNGHQVEMKVLSKLCIQHFAGLAKRLKPENILEAMNFIVPRLLIPMFVGCLPLHTTLHVMNSYILYRGEQACLIATLTLIDASTSKLKAIDADNLNAISIYSTVMSTASKFSASEMNHSLRTSDKRKYRLDKMYLTQLRAEARVDLVRQFKDSGSASLFQLSKFTQITEQELALYQDNFKSICVDPNGGLTRRQFLVFLQLSGTLMADFHISRLFEIYSSNGDGMMHFHDLVCIISVLCSPVSMNTIRLCFTMFNMSGDGKLNLTELNFMTRSLFEMQPKFYKERLTQSSSVKEKFLLEFGKAVEKSQTGCVSFSDFLFIMTEFGSTLEVLRISKNLLHPKEFTPAIRERLLSVGYDESACLIS
eukprot:TRINITY_DN8121_c0_g3_i1.p1 TRINITY_DN8121_c0_g3~~TRINITY_DN8121_c0_g3_i1.p1  ORF type:complete len:462 (-),score=106.40 TRINITY_DN8121_c0_g3_i1:29-1414(-)